MHCYSFGPRITQALGALQTLVGPKELGYSLYLI